MVLECTILTENGVTVVLMIFIFQARLHFTMNLDVQFSDLPESFIKNISIDVTASAVRSRCALDRIQ